MAVSTNAYFVGGTFATIGLSGAQQVLPSAGQNGWQVKVLSGGSSGVAFMQAAGQVTCSQGYLLGTESVVINGPASFFLAAQGSTAIVSLMPKYSDGYSLLGKF